MQRKKAHIGLALAITTLVVLGFIALSCGGTGSRTSGNATDPICYCTPTEEAAQEYRHAAKHVPLPNSVPQEIDINTMLSWPVPPAPAADAPRTGRETQLFHISLAYLQNARIFPDCDIHAELSQTPDKNAPRVIVETPIDQEYCSARHTLNHQLAQHGFTLSTISGEVSPALAVTVLGLAFQDSEHQRGSPQVATTWELNPAVVNLVQ
ncbi:MAG: hypothetical protein ACE14M_03435 [Terriglobales bacterium]